MSGQAGEGYEDDEFEPDYGADDFEEQDHSDKNSAHASPDLPAADWDEEDEQMGSNSHFSDREQQNVDDKGRNIVNETEIVSQSLVLKMQDPLKSIETANETGSTDQQFCDAVARPRENTLKSKEKGIETDPILQKQTDESMILSNEILNDTKEDMASNSKVDDKGSIFLDLTQVKRQGETGEVTGQDFSIPLLPKDLESRDDPDESASDSSDSKDSHGGKRLQLHSIRGPFDILEYVSDDGEPWIEFRGDSEGGADTESMTDNQFNRTCNTDSNSPLQELSRELQDTLPPPENSLNAITAIISASMSVDRWINDPTQSLSGVVRMDSIFGVRQWQIGQPSRRSRLPKPPRGRRREAACDPAGGSAGQCSAIDGPLLVHHTACCGPLWLSSASYMARLTETAPIDMDFWAELESDGLLARAWARNRVTEANGARLLRQGRLVQAVRVLRETLRFREQCCGDAYKQVSICAASSVSTSAVGSDVPDIRVPHP